MLISVQRQVSESNSHCAPLIEGKLSALWTASHKADEGAFVFDNRMVDIIDVVAIFRRDRQNLHDSNDCLVQPLAI